MSNSTFNNDFDDYFRQIEETSSFKINTTGQWSSSADFQPTRPAYTAEDDDLNLDAMDDNAFGAAFKLDDYQPSSPAGKSNPIHTGQRPSTSLAHTIQNPASDQSRASVFEDQVTDSNPPRDSNIIDLTADDDEVASGHSAKTGSTTAPEPVQATVSNQAAATQLRKSKGKQKMAMPADTTPSHPASSGMIHDRTSARPLSFPGGVDPAGSVAKISRQQPPIRNGITPTIDGAQGAFNHVSVSARCDGANLGRIKEFTFWHSSMECFQHIKTIRSSIDCWELYTTSIIMHETAHRGRTGREQIALRDDCLARLFDQLIRKEHPGPEAVAKGTRHDVVSINGIYDHLEANARKLLREGSMPQPNPSEVARIKQEAVVGHTAFYQLQAHRLAKIAFDGLLGQGSERLARVMSANDADSDLIELYTKTDPALAAQFSGTADINQRFYYSDPFKNTIADEILQRVFEKNGSHGFDDDLSMICAMKTEVAALKQELVVAVRNFGPVNDVLKGTASYHLDEIRYQILIEEADARRHLASVHPATSEAAGPHSAGPRPSPAQPVSTSSQATTTLSAPENENPKKRHRDEDDAIPLSSQHASNKRVRREDAAPMSDGNMGTSDSGRPPHLYNAPHATSARVEEARGAQQMRNAASASTTKPASYPIGFFPQGVPQSSNGGGSIELVSAPASRWNGYTHEEPWGPPPATSSATPLTTATPTFTQPAKSKKRSYNDYSTSQSLDTSQAPRPTKAARTTKGKQVQPSVSKYPPPQLAQSLGKGQYHYPSGASNPSTYAPIHQAPPSQTQAPLQHEKPATKLLDEFDWSNVPRTGPASGQSGSVQQEIEQQASTSIEDNGTAIQQPSAAQEVGGNAHDTTDSTADANPAVDTAPDVQHQQPDPEPEFFPSAEPEEEPEDQPESTDFRDSGYQENQDPFQPDPNHNFSLLDAQIDPNFSFADFLNEDVGGDVDGDGAGDGNSLGSGV